MGEVSQGDALVLGEVADLSAERLDVGGVLSVALDVHAAALGGVFNSGPQVFGNVVAEVVLGLQRGGHEAEDFVELDDDAGLLVVEAEGVSAALAEGGGVEAARFLSLVSGPERGRLAVRPGIAAEKKAGTYLLSSWSLQSTASV